MNEHIYFEYLILITEIKPLILESSMTCIAKFSHCWTPRCGTPKTKHPELVNTKIIGGGDLDCLYICLS